MTRYPKAAWHPVVNHSGPMVRHLGLILHVQEGTGSLAGWFDDPKAQASSTFWVSKTGHVEQYVDAGATAWAQAAGNHTYNSVETEGHHTESLTEAQVKALADLYVWGHKTFGWPLQLAEKPGERGFGWHGMGGTAWGGHTGCPGAKRKAQRAAVLALAVRALTPAKKPAAKKPTPRPALSAADTNRLQQLLAYIHRLFGKKA